MHRLADAPPTNREDGVAGLVRAFVNLKSLAAEREHLGHERRAVEFPFAVERPEDFLFAPDFHPIAYAQIDFSQFHFRLPHSHPVFAATTSALLRR
jgi:hypothetical protein